MYTTSKTTVRHAASLFYRHWIHEALLCAAVVGNRVLLQNVDYAEPPIAEAPGSLPDEADDEAQIEEMERDVESDS